MEMTYRYDERRMKQNINNKKKQKINDSVTKVMKRKYENTNIKQNSFK